MVAHGQGERSQPSIFVTPGWKFPRESLEYRGDGSLRGRESGIVG
jgi:hypothetical protein